MSSIKDQEEFYDTEIAPLLLQLASKCQERGMPFLAAVEYKPEEVGETRFVPDDACIAMQMASRSAACLGNFDGFAISLIRFCERLGIAYDQSIFLSRFTRKGGAG